MKKLNKVASLLATAALASTITAASAGTASIATGAGAFGVGDGTGDIVLMMKRAKNGGSIRCTSIDRRCPARYYFG